MFHQFHMKDSSGCSQQPNSIFKPRAARVSCFFLILLHMFQSAHLTVQKVAAPKRKGNLIDSTILLVRVFNAEVSFGSVFLMKRYMEARGLGRPDFHKVQARYRILAMSKALDAIRNKFCAIYQGRPRQGLSPVIKTVFLRQWFEVARKILLNATRG